MEEKNKTNKPISLTPEQKTIVTWGLIGIGGTAVVGGLAYFGWNWYTNVRANYERRDILEEGTPASKANYLKMAFDNDGFWGTQVHLVRRILLGLNSKQEYEQVRRSYKKLTKKDLNKDLKKELTTTEFGEMMAIKSSKPDLPPKPGTSATFQPHFLATRIYNAISYTWFGIPNTDEDALLVALNEVPSQAAFEQVKTSYTQQGYGDLVSDLDGDLWMWGDMDWRKAIQSKPISGLAGIWEIASCEWHIRNYRNRLKQIKYCLKHKPINYGCH